jgi:hypothetical protein
MFGNLDVFLVRDLRFSTQQRDEILRTIQHRLAGSVARELHTSPDCTIQEIICFYFVDAYKRLSEHSLKTRICGFFPRWLNRCEVELSKLFSRRLDSLR